MRCLARGPCPSRCVCVCVGTPWERRMRHFTSRLVWAHEAHTCLHSGCRAGRRTSSVIKSNWRETLYFEWKAGRKVMLLHVANQQRVYKFQWFSSHYKSLSVIFQIKKIYFFCTSLFYCKTVREIAICGEFLERLWILMFYYGWEVKCKLLLFFSIKWP